jgi:hypothetical protein
MAGTCGYGEGLSSSINAGNFDMDISNGRGVFTAGCKI